WAPQPDPPWIFPPPPGRLSEVPGADQRSGRDLPPGRPVQAAGDREVGDPASVLHSTHQHRLPIDLGSGRVEDGVDRIGPVRRAQHRVVRTTPKQPGYLLAGPVAL